MSEARDRYEEFPSLPAAAAVREERVREQSGFYAKGVTAEGWRLAEKRGLRKALQLHITASCDPTVVVGEPQPDCPACALIAALATAVRINTGIEVRP